MMNEPSSAPAPEPIIPTPEGNPVLASSAVPQPSTEASAQDSGGGVQAEQPPPEVAQAPFPEEVSIIELQKATLAELQALAESVGLRLNPSRTKHQIIYDICAWMAEHKTRLKVEGVLEIGSDNFGLIRYPAYSFAPMPEDVFVPLFLVRKFGLRASQQIT
ncbi:MAG: transcription termination factor Rho, partial [Verrucomicrobiales bacterium]